MVDIAVTSDDPFTSILVDRSFDLPTPGAPPPGRSAAALAPAPADVARDFPAVSIGLNPLVAVANNVLSLVPQLRATTHHPDPAQLKEQIAHSIREFEKRAKAQGVAGERVLAARYILCTLLDEAAASTPWGGSGAWTRQSLLVAFHNEAWGGEKVFQLMARLAENVAANADLLELIYACLALGFQGRYGVIEGGAAQLEAVRERLAMLLRHQRGDTPRALSINWAPALHRHSALASWLPLWVTCAALAAILILSYAAFSISLGNRGDQVEAAIRGIRLAAVAPRAPPVAADQSRLAPFLASEIQQELIAVRDDADRSVVKILGDGLFAPGSAELSDGRQNLIRRIAAALTQTPGRVVVAGHSDDRPIRTLRYPSNWDLSQARALAVGRLLLANGVAPERLRVESRGDSEPLVANDTPANRALNRRVEITLLVGR